MKKKWLGFLSFTLIALLVSGCGANGNNESVQPTNEASQSAQASNEASQPASEEPEEEVTIKYASWMSKGEDKPTIEAFMKANPHIKVEEEVIDGKQYAQLIQTRILSDDAPDVFMLPFAQYTQYAKEGHLLDLTNEPGMKLMIDTPAVDKVFTVEGKRYGFMGSSGAPINPIYFNKKIFEKYNLVPPTNAEEFLKVSEVLKANNVEPLVFGAKDAWTISGTLFTAMFRSYALPKTDNDFNYALAKGSVKPSEIMDYPLSFIGELVNKGYISKASSTLTYDQSVQYFADGKAAMLPQGTWVPTLDPIVNANKDEFELGAFVPPVPEVNGVKYAVSNGDRILVISSKTKNPEADKKLFNFFVEPGNLKVYLESQSLLSVLKGLDLKTVPVLQDYVSSIASDSFSVTIGSKSALTPAFNKEVDIALQNILVGSKVETELKRLDEEFEKTKSQMIISE
ncbi:ABC transporter substrate-binding protein [Paenibacillus nasutitermitis]|uniref:Sugar ABC transporter substrate-binding protein n=1 Tax=Paenibacillus nasutitermitis TaxID=1652958 RepID=A0A917DSD8_9BACL|nr:extracellular solute-binding protein [Paenibacillus nasutitermitis]GGD62156.1 hypothetical protein GCM10010911_20080 [Paenibacillus nasutitermitis]